MDKLNYLTNDIEKKKHVNRDDLLKTYTKKNKENMLFHWLGKPSQ